MSLLLGSLLPSESPLLDAMGKSTTILESLSSSMGGCQSDSSGSTAVLEDFQPWGGWVDGEQTLREVKGSVSIKSRTMIGNDFGDMIRFRLSQLGWVDGGGFGGGLG